MWANLNRRRRLPRTVRPGGGRCHPSKNFRRRRARQRPKTPHSQSSAGMALSPTAAGRGISPAASEEEKSERRYLVRVVRRANGRRACVWSPSARPSDLAEGRNLHDGECGHEIPDAKPVHPNHRRHCSRADCPLERHNLNTCVEAVNMLVADAGALSKAALDGKLATRADATDPTRVRGANEPADIS